MCWCSRIWVLRNLAFNGTPKILNKKTLEGQMSAFRIVVGVIVIVLGVFVGCIALTIYLLDRFGILDDDNADSDKEKTIFDD